MQRFTARADLTDLIRPFFLLFLISSALLGGFRLGVCAAFLLIVCFAAAVYLLSLSPCDETQVEQFFDSIRVVAPENTLAAIRKSKDSGADAVEFDLEMTKDGVIMLLHDETLDRTTNGSGPIRTLAVDEVRRLDAAANFASGSFSSSNGAEIEKIPTLQEAAELCHELDLKIFFDVKAHDAKMVSSLVELYQADPWLYENSMVCSFYPHVTYQVKRRDPRILTAHTWRYWYYSYTNETLVESRNPHNSLRHFFALLLDKLAVWLVDKWFWKILGVDMILTGHYGISREFVEEWRRRGVRVVGWVVNEVAEKQWFRYVLKTPYMTDTMANEQQL